MLLNSIRNIKKINKLRFTFILLVIILTSCTFNTDEAILNGYKDSEEYPGSGSQDYTDYCKYYYTEKDDEKFASNKKYKMIDNENIENVINYFYNFEQLEKENYDFNCNNINEGDYYYIKTKEGEKIGDSKYDKYDNYSIYLYDIESHTLYYIHSNI